VAALYSNQILKINASTGVVVSSWGSHGAGDGQLDGPYAVAVDSSGSVYVTETGNFRVQKFDKNGVFQRRFGTNGTGSGQFKNPRGIAVDATGRIFVSDETNQNCQAFSALGAPIGTPITGLWGPRGLALNGTWLYLVDGFHNQIFRYTDADTPVLDATYAPAAADTSNLFANPYAVAFDATYGFVVDADHRGVQRINVGDDWNDGTKWTRICGSELTLTGEFNAPTRLAVDSANNLYIADTGNHRVQELTSSGTWIRTFGGYGTSDGKFKNPSGVAVDGSGNVYVADTDNKRVQKFDATTHLYTAQWTINGGTDHPGAIGVTGSSVFVCDTESAVYRVYKFTNVGGADIGWGGSGYVGSPGPGNVQFGNTGYPQGPQGSAQLRRHALRPVGHLRDRRRPVLVSHGSRD
jgi:hypothetical protein